MSSSAIDVSNFSHHYGSRQALSDIHFKVSPGEIFAFLGPNGSGKTTLFRVLSTLIPLQHGKVSILGFDLIHQRRSIQASIGVVFQAPSLDKQLTIRENIHHQAVLYGLTGQALHQRQNDLLERLGLSERADDRVKTLSGGLRRRAELAKGMIHRPRLLLLDEPSTGLDPGARSDLWDYLRMVRDQDGVTVVMTTHLLDEADRADRIAILDDGAMVAMDAPEALKATVGGDAITIQTNSPETLVIEINERFDCGAKVVEESVRLEQPDGHLWIPRLLEAFPGRIESITLGKPTLEDVFIARCGHRFWKDEAVTSDP